MSWLDLQRVDEPEEIDNPDHPLPDLTESMADVARTNAWFGGTGAIVGHVATLLRNVPKERPVRILDIGTGSADIPRALVAWGRRHGRTITVVGVDNMWPMLRIARSQTPLSPPASGGKKSATPPHCAALAPSPSPDSFVPHWESQAPRGPVHRDADPSPDSLVPRLERGVQWPLPQKRSSRQSQSDRIHLVQANAMALPFRPGSFDIAVCALTLHHIGFDSAVKLLEAMDALANIGFVAADLRRDGLSLAMVSSGLALIRSHPFTRHDGPASVRRAFTLDEYRKMVALSGVNGVRIRTHWYYRVALVKEKRPL